MELISDVDYLESESKYLDSVNKRNISQVNQRYNRSVLAGLINKPFELPENLKKPSFDFSKQVSLEYDELIKNVMDNNPQIILAEKQLDAASKVKTAVSKQFLPRINAEIEVSENSGGFETKDDWRAGISFIVPLYENQNMKSEVSKARANWLKEQAKLFKIQIKVRNQALKLWQEISTLSERRKQLATTQEYRELNLDRSRALHEMEVKTNLGSSMAAISEVQYKQAKNDFSLALSWMQLRHLAGKQNLMKTSL